MNQLLSNFGHMHTMTIPTGTPVGLLSVYQIPAALAYADIQVSISGSAFSAFVYIDGVGYKASKVKAIMDASANDGAYGASETIRVPGGAIIQLYITNTVVSDSTVAIWGVGYNSVSGDKVKFRKGGAMYHVNGNYQNSFFTVSPGIQFAIAQVGSFGWDAASTPSKIAVLRSSPWAHTVEYPVGANAFTKATTPNPKTNIILMPGDVLQTRLVLSGTGTISLGKCTCVSVDVMEYMF